MQPAHVLWEQCASCYWQQGGKYGAWRNMSWNQCQIVHQLNKCGQSLVKDYETVKHAVSSLSDVMSCMRMYCHIKHLYWWAQSNWVCDDCQLTMDWHWAVVTSLISAEQTINYSSIMCTATYKIMQFSRVNPLETTSKMSSANLALKIIPSWDTLKYGDIPVYPAG